MCLLFDIGLKDCSLNGNLDFNSNSEKKKDSIKHCIFDHETGSDQLS